MSLKEKVQLWLNEEGPSALVRREYLLPAEGRDAIFFPPTFAPPEGAAKGSTYIIDEFKEGNTCLIDSVQSQANRMEQIFKKEPYRELVPQIIVKAKGKEINLLDAGHRAADAIVRFSDLENELETAFREFEKGNAWKLAKIAPTSLCFGVWDSRGTQVKFPRIVRSEIRAFNVEKVRRSAQYIPPLDYVGEGVIEEEELTKKYGAKVLSEWGLKHAPAGEILGGVILRSNGFIRRDSSLNLVAIRALGVPGDEKKTKKLQKYILGLALVAFTAPQDYNLRQGCLLVKESAKSPECEEVYKNGERKPVELDFKEIHQLAEEFATEFEVTKEPKIIEFKAESLKKAVENKEKKKGKKSPEG